MMKKLLFLFMAFLYSTSQVMALQCALDCVSKEKIHVKKEASRPMAMDHSCCHDKKNSPTKEKKNEGNKEKQCFHDILGKQFSSQDHVKLSLVSNKVIFLQQVPVAVFVSIPMRFASYRYKAKIPDKPYLKFKSRLDLYILKDQFLI